MLSYIYSRPITGNSLGTLTTCYTNSVAEPGYAGPLFVTIKLSSNVFIGYTPLSPKVSGSTVTETKPLRTFIFHKGKVSTETVSYGSYEQIQSILNAMRLTTSGARSNFAISQVKLPSITVSEALVYMRTE